MEQALELIVGVSFFIVGLSVIFNQKEWINFIDYAEKKGSWVVMVVGIADLLFGGFIMAFHWVWNGIGAIITIIGAILFIRGVMRLLFPRWVLGKIYNAKAFIRLCGIALIIVSGFVLYDYWRFV